MLLVSVKGILNELNMECKGGKWEHPLGAQVPSKTDDLRMQQHGEHIVLKLKGLSEMGREKSCQTGDRTRVSLYVGITFALPVSGSIDSINSDSALFIIHPLSQESNLQLNMTLLYILDSSFVLGINTSCYRPSAQTFCVACLVNFRHLCKREPFPTKLTSTSKGNTRIDCKTKNEWAHRVRGLPNLTLLSRG